MKVVVGMSGGVDSSVAAHLLKREGHEVYGLSLILFETRGRVDPKSCCSLQAIDEAADTARSVGIEHRSLDARDMFIEKVINPFVDAYQQGITPNPCILCNIHIKFPLLLEEAKRIGADAIATGHYARVEDGKLLKGSDDRKDQSYVLYGLSLEELRRLVLPLGTFKKDEIREIARRENLPVFNRPESQEICFVEGRNYGALVSAVSDKEQEPGPMLDAEGRQVGTHQGLYLYTLGQRKGLGIQSTDPHYVIDIRPKENTLVVGPRDGALRDTFTVGGVRWLVEPKEPVFQVDVKVRSMMRPALVTVTLEGDRARVSADPPIWAPSPGQAAVFYSGDVVLGGGVIVEALRK